LEISGDFGDRRLREILVRNCLCVIPDLIHSKMVMILGDIQDDKIKMISRKFQDDNITNL